jgi:hypothetical protein
VIGIGAVTAAGAATGGFGFAGSKGNATAPPIQGISPTHNMAFYVDTVAAEGDPGIAAGCSMLNLFTDGQTIVFRMYGMHVTTGGAPLTAANVLSAIVTIPGVAPVPMAYGAHGTASFWSAAWTPPVAAGSVAAYPVGVVNFVVTVRTKPVPATSRHAAIPAQIGRFSQHGLATPSVLTITSLTPPA